jgi:hypothetical protein
MPGGPGAKRLQSRLRCDELPKKLEAIGSLQANASTELIARFAGRGSIYFQDLH